MRFWITRVLLLLISVNVVYGIHGDIYADKVQVLINSSNAHISYTPTVNTDLFVVSKCKESGRPDRLFSKSFRNLLEWNAVVFTSFELGNPVNLFGNPDEIACIPSRIIRKLIFPHHFFS